MIDCYVREIISNLNKRGNPLFNVCKSFIPSPLNVPQHSLKGYEKI